jgi:hypothetical protein
MVLQTAVASMEQQEGLQAMKWAAAVDLAAVPAVH